MSASARVRIRSSCTRALRRRRGGRAGRPRRAGPARHRSRIRRAPLAPHRGAVGEPGRPDAADRGRAPGGAPATGAGRDGRVAGHGPGPVGGPGRARLASPGGRAGAQAGRRGPGDRSALEIPPRRRHQRGRSQGARRAAQREVPADAAVKVEPAEWAGRSRPPDPPPSPPPLLPPPPLPSLPPSPPPPPSPSFPPPHCRSPPELTSPELPSPAPRCLLTWTGTVRPTTASAPPPPPPPPPPLGGPDAFSAGPRRTRGGCSWPPPPLHQVVPRHRLTARIIETTSKGRRLP